MKKMNLQPLLYCFIAIFLSSCSGDDADTSINPGGNGNCPLLPISAGNSFKLSGDITTDISLTEDTYYLTGVLTVKSTGSLTIPAGAKISVMNSSKSCGTGFYILVEQGGQIFVNGTLSKPVVMDNPLDFNWGGLVIAGKAPTTNGGLNGTASGEVANVTYGGNQIGDNSGKLEYLVLKNTGAAINSESEFNGISFYGVGSGTIVNNVAVIDGEDDGVEFFGGTVNATNLWLENNQDDSVDVTEGYNGTLTDVVVSFTRDDFNSATEVEKNTNFTINGFSVYNNGLVLDSFDVENRGIVQIKKTENGGVTITNLYQEGFDLEEPALSGEFPFIAFINGTANLNGVSINGSTYIPLSNIANGTAVDTSSWNWKNASL